MTKCRIKIETNRTFETQDAARDYLSGLIGAGILFVKCYSIENKTRVKANETTFYQTQSEAKIALKNLSDAGILYLEVEKGWDE